MDYTRSKKCDNNQGGSSELYIFPFQKYSRSQITVVDNMLIKFPYNEIFNLNANNISFDEECKEDGDVYYEQKVSFQLKKILKEDNFKGLSSKDFRIVTKDNNGNYRLLGLYTGLSGSFTKSTGTNRVDFNGYSFNFETKEENTAPFLNGLSLFEKNLKITIDTSLGALDTFTIPTTIDESYLYSITTSDGYVATGVTGDHTITFPTGAGVHEITISGVFPRFYFNNSGDKDKLISVGSWGEIQYSINQNGAFYGCSNLSSISNDIQWINQITTAKDTFRSTGISSLPSEMTLSSLTNGSGTFFGNNLTSLPSGMVLDNITSAFGMFRSCSLTSLPPLMNLDNLTFGAGMFFGNNLTSLPNGMNLNLLTNGLDMFKNNSLTDLPSGMNLSSIQRANFMFSDNSLASLPASMSLSLLVNASEMFKNNSLTDLPSGIKLQSLNSGGDMFFGNTINTARYSQLLIDLESLNPNNNVSFSGGNSKYNASGETARNILTSSPRLWTITDGGLE